jgi:hypothetical protein
MRWSICFLSLALACGAISANDGTEGAGLTVGDRAPDFVLWDVDDRQHALSRLGREGKAVLLILGNRKTRKEHEAWAAAFHESYGDQDWITAYIVVDMRSAPAFAPKSLIKRKLAKSRPAATVLPDWKGKVHQAYRTQKETPNLYLVRPGGTLTFCLNANFDPETYVELKKAIDDLRPSKSTLLNHPARSIESTILNRPTALTAWGRLPGIKIASPCVNRCGAPETVISASPAIT